MKNASNDTGPANVTKYTKSVYNKAPIKLQSYSKISTECKTSSVLCLVIVFVCCTRHLSLL